MEYFFNIETKEFPRHQGDLELLGWIPGNPLLKNWVSVVYVDPPAIEENEVAFLGEPELALNGEYYMTWLVRPMTSEEILSRNIRFIKKKLENGETITQEEANLIAN